MCPKYVQSGLIPELIERHVHEPGLEESERHFSHQHRMNFYKLSRVEHIDPDWHINADSVTAYLSFDLTFELFLRNFECLSLINELFQVSWPGYNSDRFHGTRLPQAIDK